MNTAIILLSSMYRKSTDVAKNSNSFSTFPQGRKENDKGCDIKKTQ